MTVVTSLPPELLTNIILYLTPKERAYLAPASKLWHSLYAVTDLRNLKNKDQISWNAYFSNASNYLHIWDVINSTEIDKKYPIDLRLDKLKDRLPFLEVLANKKIQIKNITLIHEPSQAEVDGLFLFHPQIETVYFPQCDQPSTLNYPASLRKLFFKNVENDLRSKLQELENT